MAKHTHLDPNRSSPVRSRSSRSCIHPPTLVSDPSDIGRTCGCPGHIPVPAPACTVPIHTRGNYESVKQQADSQSAHRDKRMCAKVWAGAISRCSWVTVMVRLASLTVITRLFTATAVLPNVTTLARCRSRQLHVRIIRIVVVLPRFAFVTCKLASG